MTNFQEKLQDIKNQINKYDKKHKTFDEQLEILKERGLLISNATYAITKLNHINYYRLSAYFLPFQHKKSSQEKNKFLSNTSFENIIQLYYFDTELRKIIFEAIEVIEIYFRTQISYFHAKEFGPYGYLDIKNFKTNQDFFGKIITLITNETSRSEEEFIAHFRDKYQTKDLPIWTLVEVISFGTLSKIYTILKTDEQKIVIQKLKGINNSVFKNWLHALSVIRNICAHHSRLWNKTLGVKFEVPRKMSLFQNIQNDKIFFALNVIEYILTCIDEDELEFKIKIQQLLEKYPYIDKKAMGFADGWQNMGVWK